MRLPALALLLLALPAAGCRKSMAPACRIVCTCSPCTDHDLDTCVEAAEKAQDTAYAKECTELFDNFVDCFERNARCHTENLATTDDACTRAESHLVTCAGSGNPFSSICEQAQNQLIACNPGTSPSPITDCSGQAACTSACIAAASCKVLRGEVFDQTFNDCVNACVGVPTP